MFDAKYFTCILQKIQNKYNIALKTEIIELIFNYYNYENMLRQKYERYNLFELIILLDNSNLKSELNKKAIIDTFVNNKYDTEYYDYIFLKTLEPACQPTKLAVQLACQPTRLTLELDCPKETVQNYKTEEQNNNIKWKPLKYNNQLYSIIIVDNNGKDIMQIYNDDIIKIDNKEYRIYMSSDGCIDNINKYYNVSYVKLEDLDTNIETKITKQEFIDIFKNVNVTYISSRLINWLNANKKN
jgi:hypothetical protein